MDLADLPARDLLAAFARGEASPVEALEACVARIAARDRPLRAFAALCLERAFEEAAEAEAAWARGSPSGPLCGVPLAVKDLFDAEGMPATYGSPVFAAHRPERDAPAVAAVRAAGAVVVGKSVTHEFAWGMTGRHATFGPTRNPWDPARTPGGSSSGSAVALATGMAALALGTDTGGSIRLPAALCGVTGHKPTHGAVPLEGVWPLVPEFDHAGPMARTPADAALLLGVLTGRPAAAAPAEPLRVGRPDPASQPELPEATAAALDAAAAALAQAGAEVSEVPFPAWRRFVEAYAPIFDRGALRTHTGAGLWPQRRAEYDPSVAERLALAEAATAADEERARRLRGELDAEVGELLGRVDVLLTAVTAAAPPPRQDEPGDLRAATTPLACPQDLLGLPACAVRAGFDAAGMPVGVQLTARRGADDLALAAADLLFRATPEVQRPRAPAGPPRG